MPSSVEILRISALVTLTETGNATGQSHSFAKNFRAVRLPGFVGQVNNIDSGRHHAESGLDSAERPFGTHTVDMSLSANVCRLASTSGNK